VAEGIEWRNPDDRTLVAGVRSNASGLQNLDIPPKESVTKCIGLRFWQLTALRTAASVWGFRFGRELNRL